MDLETLWLGDGRSLEFCVSGPADASEWLVFHVGTPNAATLFSSVTSVVEGHGIRVASYSRGGYGGSTRLPDRTVAQEATDTAALADHLGATSFSVVGWSGGGPAALACAALLPERVRSCVILAGSSPPEEVGPGWFGWHDDAYAQELRTFATGSPEPYRRAYEEATVPLATLPSEELTTSPDLPEVDRDAFARRPGLGEEIADSFRRALAGGPDGWMDDAVASARPWGFRVGDIRVPVTVRHGELDTFLNVEHGRWLAEHIPGATAQILSDHGHISIAEPYEPVMDALLRSETGDRTER
jgi:pimeloyl-ACP methyl ester carboxylesterase